MFKKGVIPWNKGKKGVYTEEVLAGMRLHALADVSTNEIIKLYQQGKSCYEIARLLNSNYSVVWRRLIPTGLLRDRGAGNRSRVFSIEHCKAISEGRKKFLSNPVNKEKYCMGQNNPFYGKKHNPKTIAAMKVKLSILLSGENNPQWQGGKSFLPYTSTFKRRIRHWVYVRDNYTCQQCGISHEAGSGRLVAHHRDTDKNNSYMDNLITLCRPCHGKISMGARWGKEVNTPN